MKAGDLIVKNHRPVRSKLYWLGMAVVALGVVVAIYTFGVSQGGYYYLESKAEKAKLEADIAAIEQEKKALQSQVIMLKQTQAVDGSAYEDVRNSLKQLQDEILELRQEVEFYRGIVSPAERLAGIAIQSFDISPTAQEGLHHYELVLTQMLKNDKFVKGRVNVYVNGVQEGQPKKLQFKDLTPNDSVNRDLGFRYFQKVEGDVRLPEGFVARDVVVEIVPKGRKRVTKSFPWREVAG